MKRFFSFLLIVALLASCLLTGCKENDPPEDTTPEAKSDRSHVVL